MKIFYLVDTESFKVNIPDISLTEGVKIIAGGVTVFETDNPTLRSITILEDKNE